MLDLGRRCIEVVGPRRPWRFPLDPSRPSRGAAFPGKRKMSRFLFGTTPLSSPWPRGREERGTPGVVSCPTMMG